MRCSKNQCCFIIMLLFLFAVLPRTSFAEKGDILDYSLFDITPGFQENASGLFQEPYDIRHLRWGMTPEEVLMKEEIETYGKVLHKNFLQITVPERRIVKIPCTLTYTFAENRLSSILSSFHAELFRLNKYVDNFERLEFLLVEKYGSPLEKKVLWQNPESPYMDDPESFGMAVALGDLLYRTHWNTGTTIIHLSLEGEALRCRLSLHYQSSALASREEEAAKEALLSEL